MSKNCGIVRDLMPMYVENLASEESIKFIENHLKSCEACKKYYRNLERDLPDNGSVDFESDKNEQVLIKGMKKSINKMIWIAVLIGVLIGTFSPMMFFNQNNSQVSFVVYPMVTFLIGLLSFILVKKIWVGPIVTLIGGFMSAIIFSNLSPWLFIIGYTIFTLLGSFVGKLMEKVKSKTTKTTLKVLISIAGVLVAICSLLILSFLLDMTPDKSEEKIVIEQAEDYLEKTYPNGNYEIYDVLYDNMGNFDQFEYAAKVRDLDSGEEFYVYYNEQAKQMEDSIKYADEFY